MFLLLLALPLALWFVWSLACNAFGFGLLVCGIVSALAALNLLVKGKNA